MIYNIKWVKSTRIEFAARVFEKDLLLQIMRHPFHRIKKYKILSRDLVRLSKL